MWTKKLEEYHIVHNEAVEPQSGPTDAITPQDNENALIGFNVIFRRLPREVQQAWYEDTQRDARPGTTPQRNQMEDILRKNGSPPP